MPPSRSLPPVEFCLGTSPIHADTSRAEPKACGSGMLATRAVAIGANTGDRFKAPAQLIRPVPGKDTPVSLEDLPLHQRELGLQGPQAFLCCRRYTLIHPSVDEPEQPLYTVAADTGD